MKSEGRFGHRNVGFFLTLEGGEGVGKSTLAATLATELRGRGHDVEVTREPGGSPRADALRRLLLEGEVDDWGAAGELLLMTAARLDHLRERVVPALQRGALVICDRYRDSTRVYQGIAGGLGLEKVDLLNEAIVPVTDPDLTVLLDLPVEEGLRRRVYAGAVGRFEAKGRDFHERVRAGFLELARREPRRIVVLDAARPPAVVASDALERTLAALVTRS